MEFRRYQSLKRYGETEVIGIEFGDCFIFPKVDGTNGSVYLRDGEVKAGSRNRELSLDNDNQGFYAYILSDDRVKKYLKKHPTHRLFGEFLVRHTLKTYRDDAWRKFYIFDVCIDKNEEEVEYLTYDAYKPLLEEFDLDYIPPIAKIKNPTYESLVKCLERNNFLIKDGQGVGEGIVVKSYDFYNRFGNQVWAKIVSSEFKEKHVMEMGYPEINVKITVEELAVDEYCTEAFIEKEYAKIVAEKDGWRNEYIPMLFGKIFYEFVNESMWEIVKKYKNPIINFGFLKSLIIQKVKKVKSDLF